jgi:hypothetical protein
VALFHVSGSISDGIWMLSAARVHAIAVISEQTSFLQGENIRDAEMHDAFGKTIRRITPHFAFPHLWQGVRTHSAAPSDDMGEAVLKCASYRHRLDGCARRKPLNSARPRAKGRFLDPACLVQGPSFSIPRILVQVASASRSRVSWCEVQSFDPACPCVGASFSIPRVFAQGA